LKGEYTGDWKGAEMEGEGTFKTHEGDIYTGYNHIDKLS